MRCRWFWWLLVIIWCAMIFSITASPIATSEHTEKIIAGETGLPDKNVEPIDAIVRKAAHVALFAILAMLFQRALQPKPWSSPGAWFFTTLYGASDEWHQVFVPGRTALASDVMIDSAGALTALVLVYLVMLWKGQKYNSWG